MAIASANATNVVTTVAAVAPTAVAVSVVVSPPSPPRPHQKPPLHTTLSTTSHTIDYYVQIYEIAVQQLILKINSILYNKCRCIHQYYVLCSRKHHHDYDRGNLSVFRLIYLTIIK